MTGSSVAGFSERDLKNPQSFTTLKLKFATGATSGLTERRTR